MEIHGGVLAGGAVLIALGGAAVGWLAHGPTVRVEPVDAPTDVVSQGASSPATRSASVPSAPDEADTCATELAMMRAAYSALEEEAFGAPRPFPTDVPPAFQPDGFREAVDALVEHCPELDLGQPFVDCEEYPCQVAFLVGQEGATGMDSRGLNQCAEWDRRMEGAGAAVGTNVLHLDGQTRRAVIFSPTPPDDVPPENASKRTFHRFRLNHERFVEELGGRPLTELEQTEGSIAMWERQLEGVEDPEHREFLENLLERERTKRDALRAGGGR